MLGTAPRRLPGIRFEAPAPDGAPLLPRMDVAGFVGFAAMGPVDRPVAIEDPAEFADVFGADAPLAWDAEAGRDLHAHLGPAVRSFFRNGGRRCWVVRVADRDTLATTALQVPGVVAVDGDGAIGPALAAAASPGSWADAMRVAASVESAPVAVAGLDAVAPWNELSAEPGALTRGDLVLARFRGPERALLAFVGEARGTRLWLDDKAAFWMSPAPLATGATGTLAVLDGTATRVTLASQVVGSAPGDATRFSLSVPAGRAPAPGAVAVAAFGPTAAYVHVLDVEGRADGTSHVIGLARAITPATPSTSGTVTHVQRLTLRLSAEVPGRAAATLAGLGLGPAHPRFLGHLPAPAAEGRFPVAVAAAERIRYLPLMAPAAADPWLPAMPPAGAARVRDGLTRLTSKMFVDAALRDVGVEALTGTADWIRYRAASPRPLHGAHGLMEIDEVTLVAIPDAVQPGWKDLVEPDVVEPAAPGGSPPEPPAGFADCEAVVLTAPVLRPPIAAAGAVTLEWAGVAGATGYELEEGTAPGFSGAARVYAGPATTFTVYGRPAGATMLYRVRAVAGGAAGPWAVAPPVRVDGPPRPTALRPGEDPYDETPLLETQRALLRMCAARGDLLAVLAMPQHYRVAETKRHARALAGEAAAFGALYHPWLYCAEGADATRPRLVPPDAAMAGVAAARAARRGAWVAPANEPLRDVLALAPALEPSARQQLFDAQVNLVLHEAGAFLCLSADTLAEDARVRPVGVRRLMALLRRVALEHGQALAFETNGDVTRRTLRRSFEGLLSWMFERGAFAGRTPDEGYLVRTPAGRADLDAGRLVVELRVAPSRPLEFITVRLVRVGGDGVRVEVS